MVDFQFEITIIFTIKLENVDFKMKPGCIVHYVYKSVSLYKWSKIPRVESIYTIW